MEMLRKKMYIPIVALVAMTAIFAACSEGLSEEDVEERARIMAEGMAAQGLTEADVEARAMVLAEGMAAQGLTEADVEARAMVLAEEMVAAQTEGDGRLAAVKSRGNLVCASNKSLAGFGYLDDGGNTVGFDVDLCRAVAVAVLGDADAVEYRHTTAAERGPVIQSGEVDILSRNTTWTSSRDGGWGNFAPTMFYDGQGFMVSKDLPVSELTDLARSKVCVLQGTTTELNLQDFSNQNGLDLDVVTFPDNISASAAYQAGQCDSLTTDRSGLVATRAGFTVPSDHTILPGTISEEPLGPVVPHGDEQWYDIVKTVMSILIYAEAYGITSDNVPTSASDDPAIDRLLGFEGSYGQEAMGLSATVAQDVIRAVGNYSEIYDRHLTPLGLERAGSRNALWSSAPCMDCPKGGQIYSPPLR